MLASLLRPRKGRRRRPEPSPYSSPFVQRAGTANGYFDPAHGNNGSDEDEDQYDAGGEDEDDHDPVLPIFSAEHLDRLPIYNITHSIRLLVLQRCETTLSWDQLRSPQVSQFLVKPIQQEIRATLFSRGTLYALIANCLNFQKQGEANPGNVGVERTRGLICELLAMRLLKEFSTRELIDALSYDFDPLQGWAQAANATGRDKSMTHARISTVEIAIRAQAKKFLAHPLVVQQLQAIWSGTIVFHSYADSLHRPPAKRNVLRGPNYGTMDNDPGKMNDAERVPSAMIRRTVTLYDPHEASLFKLSRLRVPRYRQIFSTASFAVMLALFLMVLAGKSTDITALEVVFWFWSAGYLLEEIVAYTEQGFNLYILSVWNAFDLGILLLFLVYYVLRLYGILMPDVRKSVVAGWAYDVLASTAVLLFPRLFSVLDHYRYFSQLLIAFRMMAMDLMAILVLIVISCSGFFVAFTLAFGDNGLTSAGSAAYALFQLLMGFTPAAWDMWGEYNLLGRAILILFLFIAHFLIVTILITVLTNSFMAVVQNSNEEHQFLFAVNTISMVKSDALFSYIAPTNIIAWLLTPLRYMMPFRSFVKMNRTLIKITHFPVLMAIFSYERLILSRIAFQPEELVEQRGRSRTKVPVAFTIHGAGDLFSPGTRLREPSITTFQKDRALDEVFRRPFTGPTPSMRHPISDGADERRKSSNVVRDWMKGMGHEGGASPPEEEPRSVLDRLEQTKRPGMRRARTSKLVPSRRTQPIMARSVASDPDVTPTNAVLSQYGPGFGGTSLVSLDEQPQQTDADGDDELVTNDDNEDDRITLGQSVRDGPHLPPPKVNEPHYETSEGEEYFKTPVATKSHTPAAPGSVASRIRDPPPLPRPSSSGQERRHHRRTISTNTILFSPEKNDFGSGHESNSTAPGTRPPTGHRSGTATPKTKATPKRPAAGRPNLSPLANMSPPNPLTIGFGNLPRPSRSRRDPSFNALALDLASDLGDNRPRPELPGMQGLSASFSTQMEMAAMGARRFPRRREMTSNDDEEEVDEEEEDRSRTNRILLARMNTLEESFKEVLKEVRNLKTVPSAEKKGKNNKKGTKTPVTAGSRTPGASSAGGGSTGTGGTGGTTATAFHDGNVVRHGSDDDRASIRRIEEAEHESDMDSSRSSL